ncbi:MAG: Re/Si-specific NAD(P)(+) transhydrogenase subunit alpha [Bradymonadaceae bacterium]
MKIGIPKEVHPGEKRVAATPDTVTRLAKKGYEVLIETGAGAEAQFRDSAYEEAGATIVADAATLWSEATMVVKVRPPEHHPVHDCDEVELLPEGGMLISLIYPGHDKELVERLAARKATVLALDCIPRISRGQAMDVLSSQAGISGYRAILEAGYHFGRYFGVQFTAAGKTDPAHVLVIGAGVAGLAATAAARERGAVVRAFDTRSAAREEVETLGATFLEVEFEEDGDGKGGYAKVMSPEFIAAEMALFQEQAPITDIVITTAAIPGKRAPLLVKKEMVEAMKPGSVIIDLAAETGGNCELTVAGEVVEHNGVKIIGFTDLTSRLPTHASEFFGRNIANLFPLFGDADEFAINLEDEIITGMIVLHFGKLMWPPPPKAAPDPAPKAPDVKKEVDAAAVAAVTVPAAAHATKKNGKMGLTLAAGFALGLALLIGAFAPADFIQHFAIFVLACFVGWKLIWNVKAALHTPLMSVTNAISGIIIVGGILKATTDVSTAALVLGAAATLVASINVFGGFLVTQRMLKMFRSDKEASHV